MNETGPSVLDAGPLIHLDELGCLDRLEGLGDLHVPQRVREEVQQHRPSLPWASLAPLHTAATPVPISPRLGELGRELSLQPGEMQAVALALHLPGALFLTDDAAARQAAERLGLKVHGSVGLVVRAIRRGTRTPEQVRAILRRIPTDSTLHLSRSLLERVLAQLP